MKLDKIDEAHLQWLRRQVDHWQEESLKLDGDTAAKSHLDQARRALRSFVRRKREHGYTI
jgi:cob(I)alamin adenosyltransferase